ncbi:KTSC domain-containing protein [Methanofollis ethanolicus]|nr:KTSC domain-containing protein [Methanofollis ethanolicus]
MEFRSGRLYRYSGVPAAVYDVLLAAPSHGRYLNASVKGRYPCARVG